MEEARLKLKEAQKIFLKVFAKHPGNFALSGGTALELYYLHHRNSLDLDFFSPAYNFAQINTIISEFRKSIKCSIKLENEFILANWAKVRFYNVTLKGLKRPLKLDFVEDVIFTRPKIKKFNEVPVYSVDNIYLQKILAIIGTQTREDEVGRQFTVGRQEARDAFDIYMLSKKIKPLHLFLKSSSSQIQRGMIHWYRTFSRQDLKLGLLDLDIYIDKFDSREMIRYLEDQIEKFTEEVAEK